jgi:hypothetical protein
MKVFNQTYEQMCQHGQGLGATADQSQGQGRGQGEEGRAAASGSSSASHPAHLIPAPSPDDPHVKARCHHKAWSAVKQHYEPEAGHGVWIARFDASDDDSLPPMSSSRQT